MTITRRELIGQGSILAALAAMPAALSIGAEAKSKTPAPPKTLAPPAKTMFASLKGQAFSVTSSSTTQALTLVSIDDIPAPEPPDTSMFSVQPPATAPQPQPTAFSLRFYGGVKNLAQGTYTFQQKKTGQFSLFIVPSGDGQRYYTAIFNQF